MKRLLLASIAACTFQHTVLAADDSGLYVGVGYAHTNVNLKLDTQIIQDTLLDTATDSVVLKAGYDLNQYFGLEGRYYFNASEAAYQYYLGNTPVSGSYKAHSFAFYAKPQYSLAMLNFYGLLGVSANDYTLNNILGSKSSDTLFSWGAGVKFKLTESFGAFVDYTDLGKSSDAVTNKDLSSWNIGFSYKF